MKKLSSSRLAAPSPELLAYQEARKLPKANIAVRALKRIMPFIDPVVGEYPLSVDADNRSFNFVKVHRSGRVEEHTQPVMFVLRSLETGITFYERDNSGRPEPVAPNIES